MYKVQFLLDEFTCIGTHFDALMECIRISYLQKGAKSIVKVYDFTEAGTQITAHSAQLKFHEDDII